MKIERYVQESLLLAIGSAYDTIWRDLNLQLRKQNCNMLQAVILISLFFEASETVTPSLLSKTLRTSAGNISHCITYLEKKGWIQRVLSAADARSYCIRLRPEGRKLACRLIRIIDDLEIFFERECGKESVSRVIRDFSKLQSVYRSRRGAKESAVEIGPDA